MMLKLALAAAVLAAWTGPAAAEDIDSDMGPAEFLWPDDRVWSAAADNTAPCGSVAEVVNRTSFPMTGGFVALVDQEEGFDVQVSISYSQDPTSNDQFAVLVAASRIQDLYMGHTCVQLPDAISNVTAGTNATLQMKYSSVWDSTTNQTFYACADITYVEAADFDSSYDDYCFNATETPIASATTASSTGASATASATSTSASSSSPSSTSGSKSSSGGGISKGAIAGAVVGSVVGAAVLALAGLLLYRAGARNQRKIMMKQQERQMGYNTNDNDVNLQNLK